VKFYHKPYRLNPFTADPVKALHFAVLYNPPFLIFDIWALRTERHSAQMSKIKNGGLDQYGAEPFELQQFGTAGVERVKKTGTAFRCVPPSPERQSARMSEIKNVG